MAKPARLWGLLGGLLLFLAYGCDRSRPAIDKAQDVNWQTDRVRWNLERARNAKDVNQKIDAILDTLEAMDEASRRLERQRP